MDERRPEFVARIVTVIDGQDYPPTATANVETLLNDALQELVDMRAIRSYTLTGGLSDVPEEGARATIESAIRMYVPDGYRDGDGLWREGPHRAAALAALAGLLDELRLARERAEQAEKDAATDVASKIGPIARRYGWLPPAEVAALRVRVRLIRNIALYGPGPGTTHAQALETIANLIALQDGGSEAASSGGKRNV